jgi:IclR family transcriptional regulator, acetate operon repressor
MKNPPAAEPPRYPVKSVGNALRLLLLLHDRQMVRVSDASVALGVSPSTAHRLLGMLQHHGFAQQAPTSRAYVAGPALLTLAVSATRRTELREQGRAHLERLVEETGETAHLAVLDGRRVLFLDSVETPRALRVAARSGTSAWAHCTSVGKVLLAELPDDRVLDLYSDHQLPAQTERSIATTAELMAALEEVRAQGFALNRGESEPGVGSVGVVVHDRLGRAVAALSTAAPLARLVKPRLQAIVDATRRAAVELGAEVGGDPSLSLPRRI